ncbi:hemoglobin subunit alpha-like [Arapaima gigas]
MSLNAKDKATVKAFWGKISGKADELGAEALARAAVEQHYNIWSNILFHNLMVAFALYFPGDYTPEVQVSVEKFFQNVAFALSDKYR